MIPYEILIRGNKDGILSGCHVIDTPGADARPITDKDLADIAPAINAAAITESKDLAAKHAEALAVAADELAGLQAELAAQAEYIARVGAVREAIVRVIQDPSVGDVATVASISAVIIEAEKPEAEKARAEKLAQFETLKAELGIK